MDKACWINIFRNIYIYVIIIKGKKVMSLREQGSAHGGGKDERKGRNDELYYKLKK